MTHRRWSDNDHNFGPFTYAKDKYKNLAIVLRSGDEEYPSCIIQMTGLGHTLICALPPIIRPWKRKVVASTWDTETIARLGRNWYFDVHEREYGLSYCNDKQGRIGGGGFLQVFLGRQTNDSSTEQRWGYFTPWNNWRHVRHSCYDLEGNHFWTEPESKPGRWSETYWNSIREAENACPSRTFSFKDFDGEDLTARTRIEERQWEMGTGRFKWLCRFHNPIVHRSLDIMFSGETGKRKGSWKGGTVGHSIEMLSGELHEAAFQRYCTEHEMTFGGEVEAIRESQTA